MSVIILGINDGHNAGAALVKDGEVIAAVQEERLCNVKNFSGVPELAIKEVFKIAKIHPYDINVIAMVSLNRVYAPLKEMPLRVKLFTRLSPLLHGHSFSSFYVKVLHKFRPMQKLNKIFSGLGIDNKEVVFVEHQKAHAACAFYSTKHKKALVFTSDGAGDGLSSTVNIGFNNKIKRIASSTYYDSLSNVLYSEITRYLGMKPWEHEFKVMGMAPYGKAEYCINEIRKMIRINPRNPLEFQNMTKACGVYIQKKLIKMLAGQRFDNISAACQLYFEELMEKWVRAAVKKTGIHDLVFAGGSALNVKANKVIREMPEVDSAFFYPASDDGGTPVGAALEAYNRYCEANGVKPVRREIKDLYYGMEYSNDYVKDLLKKKAWLKKASFIDNIDEEVGEMIAKGNIIARCTGRVEWGPRALGNRSILADPRDLKVIGKINFAIKQRDFWMPFAVSILEERMKDYLINAKFAPYMIEAFDTTEKVDDIIAGTHPFDKTARPQIVNEWNPSYKKIIQTFEARTGIGAVLNTSFNLHGYPLIGTPDVALITLENSGLKWLAMGNYLIKK